LLGHTPYAGAFLLMGEALRWLVVDQSQQPVK
jgi:hypothetical protein